MSGQQNQNNALKASASTNMDIQRTKIDPEMTMNILGSSLEEPHALLEHQRQSNHQKDVVPPLYNPNASSGVGTTAPFLANFSLVAEAAKRAQLAVMTRDLDGINLRRDMRFPRFQISVGLTLPGDIGTRNLTAAGANEKIKGICLLIRGDLGSMAELVNNPFSTGSTDYDALSIVFGGIVENN
ncbi:hypothetical protein KEM54_000373 [Ascosphaera aggregata]|nr:hypothetical protein KEM54_000373 [Ascosphaera aggregata]